MDAASHPLAAVLALVPELREPREVSVLPGGLTNANYRVRTDAATYVVRRWDEDSGLLAIDRDNEYLNSVRAAAAGVGAPVIAYLPEHNALVIEFLPGRTLCAPDLRDPARQRALALACRRLHAAERFRDDFDMFAIQARYRRIVAERGFRLPERYDEFTGHVAAIGDALRARPEPTVPCHNDLLAENLLEHDGALRLIDYEYSGNNEPSFELGNAWSESDLDQHALAELVAVYWGAPLTHKVARARLWGLMAKYGWTLWASIQDGVSTIDFDFWAWGMEKYERAVAEFDGPEFERLLAQARAPG
jgi:thiamine kinase-like enzyme